MFDSLTGRLGGIFDGLMKRGVLKEEHVSEALRMVRVALLEADVALPVAKEFGVFKNAINNYNNQEHCK